MGDTRVGARGGPNPPRERGVSEVGRVLGVRELAREYVVIGIGRAEVIVRRKSDAQVGALRFRHGPGPTVFFGFRPLPVG